MMPQPSAVSTIYAPLPKTRKRGPTTQPLSLGQTMTDNEIMTAKPKKIFLTQKKFTQFIKTTRHSDSNTRPPPRPSAPQINRLINSK